MRCSAAGIVKSIFVNCRLNKQCLSPHYNNQKQSISVLFLLHPTPFYPCELLTRSRGFSAQFTKHCQDCVLQTSRCNNLSKHVNPWFTSLIQNIPKQFLSISSAFKLRTHSGNRKQEQQRLNLARNLQKNTSLKKICYICCFLTFKQLAIETFSV